MPPRSKRRSATLSTRTVVAHGDPDRALTVGQRAFVDRYLVDLNAARSYRDVYRSTAEVADTNGPRLLQLAHVAKAIAAAIAERARRVQLKADHVVEEMAVLTHSCIDDYIVGPDGRLTTAPGVPRDALRAVASVKYRQREIPATTKKGKPTIITEAEVRLWDKPGSLRLAAQHLGMLTEKHEFSGPAGAPIEVNVHDVRERVAGRIAGIAARVGTNGDSHGALVGGARSA